MVKEIIGQRIKEDKRKKSKAKRKLDEKRFRKQQNLK